MNKKKILLTIVLTISMISLLNAQISKRTGNIVGTITDDQGGFLPGVSITVEGPNLQGTMSDVTREDGSFRVRLLPPGTYTLTAELGGFQIVKRQEIVVHVGMTIEINFQMAQSPVQEEIVVVGETPTVDVRSNKTTLIMDAESMAKIPMNRDLYSIIAAAPGAIQDYREHFVVHGGTGISQSVDIDGVHSNWAADNMPWFSEIGYDSMEEVEIITGGIPAEDTVPGGALINVVTKSGGNEFHGQIQTYYTNEKLNQYLFGEEYLESLGLSQPSVSIYDVEPTLQLGGPVIKDRLWFFTDMGYNRLENHSSFIPTTIDGVSYDTYDYMRDTKKGFLKLSFRVTDSLRGFVMGSYLKYRDPDSGGSRQLPEVIQDYSDASIKFNANVSWFASRNTIVDARFGLSRMEDWILPQEGSEGLPNYYDYYTSYEWGGPWRQRHSKADNFQSQVNLTHFAHNLMGANHEIKAGVLYQHIYYKWPWFAQDPRGISLYDGDIYYWRALYGTNEPTYFGDGYLLIRYCAPNDGESYSRGDMVRYGGFIQDSMTFKDRLTLNVGVRYDYYKGYCPAADKEACSPLSEAIGEYALTPMFGFNALGAMHMDEWSDALSWGALSPRFGFTYDLFGDGKTAIKGSFSVYTDFMSTMYFDTSHPFREWCISFNWWDTNGNRIQDAPPTDHYEFIDWAKNPETMDPEFYTKTVDNDAKSPLYWEYTLGIDHELFTDFSVGLKYIYKTKTNTVDSVWWDPETEKYWYHYDQAPEYWVPFTTIIPEYDSYPEQEVTMYFPSSDAPLTFQRFANVPEAERRYHGVQIAFNKRMSHGWSLGGSAVFSRTRGNNSGGYGSVWGYGAAYNNANWWVNRYGPTEYDKPYYIKLYGSFELPYGFILSFNARMFSGEPFQRTVTVYAPAGWAAANNAKPYNYSVNVEPQGQRRTPDEGTVDFRVEKEFQISSIGRLGIFLDVFNLFGQRMLYVTYNPGGQWYPTEANTSDGTFNPSYWYGKATGSTGQRIFKFSLRFRF